jgi:hypothetical protein
MVGGFPLGFFPVLDAIDPPSVVPRPDAADEEVLDACTTTHHWNDRAGDRVECAVRRFIPRTAEKRSRVPLTTYGLEGR